ncbi:UDP-N-acetylglucosamine 2-epimerase (non-hydrolyzing) [Pelagibacteraceae bacterium]|jgi:UDP-N-acetylglucosamine 2-epimerase (non-hydrolysing)|nr:UDP-N-acetylglucosamine 2-epimerase (non-hydrolyzing) [Pelagibacteraceae bacterium]
MKKKILTILGTRPELIKMFPIINKLDKKFNNQLVWSGQHYDYSMVKQNFKDVKLRAPNIEIKIKKNKNVFFQIQEKLHDIILKQKPNAIIYHGDTYTTLAASLVSNYFFYKIKKIHIEGGYRSGDKNQIEERARSTSDQLSNIIFVTRNQEKQNLLKENIKDNVYIVGNSITDSIKDILKKNKKKSSITNNHNLKDKQFIYVTIHRSENVDHKKRILKIVKIINTLAINYKIIFPIHPRTEKRFKKLGVKLKSNIILIPPISYSESIHLLSKCFFCFSDSGGLQEEAIILKKRCLVPSDKTPHTHYLDKNANHLVNMNNMNFLSPVKKFVLSVKNNKPKKFVHKNNTAQLITNIIKKII